MKMVCALSVYKDLLDCLCRGEEIVGIVWENS